MAKKRANGEGNIRKRKDGRWEGRYTAGYDSKTGKRLIKNVLGKTQAEVKEKLKKALEETNGLDVSKAADEYTVTSWLRTWYELYAKPNVRTATANRYELIIETYTIPRIGHIKLKKLTTRHLQKLYKELLESGRIHVGKKQNKGLSSTTVHSVAHPSQSLRGLHCTQAPKAGNENPAPGAYKSLPGCGRGQRPAPHVLPGAGQRPAEGGTGGPAMGRP